MDFSRIKMNSARDRINLVTLEKLMRPGEAVSEQWNPPELIQLAERIKFAKANNRPIILSMGAHVIKNGLSPYLIELMQLGFVTHLASNGAGSIHDFELCWLGGTSEDVSTAIEDGSFGMWDETCTWMNEALKQGAAAGYGFGEALARYMDMHPGKFPYTNDCVLYQAYKLGIPATYHIALGTDIIHQHPDCDFGAIGKASGVDFHKMCESVAKLDGGVFLNFGSGVIGPEVFLKALSIARNLGYQSFNITTANFDLVDLGDYRSDIGYGDPLYYYRPRKNIVLRPTSQGGRGWHFTIDHKISIPNLYSLLTRL